MGEYVTGRTVKPEIVVGMEDEREELAVEAPAAGTTAACFFLLEDEPISAVQDVVVRKRRTEGELSRRED